MTQVEVSRAMQRELRKKVSQSYLSQIENGSRPHLTSSTRELLAKFFKIHPGFLVDDPKGFDANLDADLDGTEGKLDLWLMQGARRFGDDAELSGALMRIAGRRTRGARSCCSVRYLPSLAWLAGCTACERCVTP